MKFKTLTPPLPHLLLPGVASLIASASDSGARGLSPNTGWDLFILVYFVYSIKRRT